MMGLGMRFRALVAVVGMLLTAVAVDAMAATKVNSVRLWRAPDNTRLVFDLSGTVQHSVFTLTAPDRLVIDINGATLAAPLKVSTANTPIPVAWRNANAPMSTGTAVSVAATAVSVTATVVETTVDVAAAGVDAVVDDDEEEEVVLDG